MDVAAKRLHCCCSAAADVVWEAVHHHGSTGSLYYWPHRRLILNRVAVSKRRPSSLKVFLAMIQLQKRSPCCPCRTVPPRPSRWQGSVWRWSGVVTPLISPETGAATPCRNRPGAVGEWRQPSTRLHAARGNLGREPAPHDASSLLTRSMSGWVIEEQVRVDSRKLCRRATKIDPGSWADSKAKIDCANAWVMFSPLS